MIKQVKKNAAAQQPRVDVLDQAHLKRVAAGEDPPMTKIRETLVGD
jgi:hypothetical protein